MANMGDLLDRAAGGAFDAVGSAERRLPGMLDRAAGGIYDFTGAAERRIRSSPRTMSAWARRNRGKLYAGGAAGAVGLGGYEYYRSSGRNGLRGRSSGGM